MPRTPLPGCACAPPFPYRLSDARLLQGPQPWRSPLTWVPNSTILRLEWYQSVPKAGTHASAEETIMIKPRIIVTGATGKTGSVVVSELLKAGYPVRAMVRREDGRSA